MNRRQFLPLTACAVFLSACASKFKTYNGPEVTQIIVKKSSRKMWLMHKNRALKTYNIDLGFTPRGHKQFEGDGKTPEGTYYIDRRNPNSEFYLSLGISYPNEEDIAYAKAHNQSPGGDIFIHGGPVLARNKGKKDWTYGCISVTNRQMRDVYAMVKNGTRIDILA